MKQTLIIFAAIVMMAGFSAKVMAQGSTAGNNANATIKTAITLSAVNPLEFGRMAVTGIAGTVLLTPAGAPTPTNVQLLSGITRTAASYTSTGEASANYAISIPLSPITITLSPGNTMTVGSFVCSKGATSTFDGTGNDAFTVGGTLNVGASQLAGAYTGTFNVTIDYN
ncbi:MAG: DUF4402 domain-containing protein [Bacteroidota bacterium]